MVGLTRSKSGKGFGSIPDKNPCKRPGCFQKGRFKCKYCNLLFCERHIAPLPYGYINDFDKKGHNCYDLPTNKTINDIIKEYPYLTKEDKNSKDEICPKCNKKDKIIPIVYGYPSKQLLEDVKIGKFVLGGCVVRLENPKYYCKRCKKRFGRIGDNYPKPIPIPPPDPIPPKPTPPKPPKPNPPKIKNKKFIWIILLVIAALIIIGVFFYVKHQEQLKADYDKLPKCYDGTVYNSCSKQKPMYCYEGKLIESAQDCGCPEGYERDFRNCKKADSLTDDNTIIEDTNEKSSINNFFDSLKLWWNNIKSPAKNQTNNPVATTKTNDNKIDTEGIKNFVSEIYSPPEPISDKTKAVEQAILKYSNQERQNNGLSVLQGDESLSIIARDHSLDMATNDFFAHDNLNGEDPTARAIRHGYNVHKELGGGWYSDGIAENIGKMPTGNVMGMGYISNNAESVGKAQVQSWMESPGHRANILKSDYLRLGVGCAYDGLYYVCTQDFY